MKTFSLLACLALCGCIGLRYEKSHPHPESGYLLVVAPDELAHCAERVAADHRDHYTHVVTLSDIGEDAAAEDIDDYIESYATWHRKLNVILIGTRHVLPAHEIPDMRSGKTVWSDWQYSIKYERTIPVGRIPVGDEAECEEYLENHVETGSPYRRTVLMFGDGPEIEQALRCDVELAYDLGLRVIFLREPNEDELAYYFRNPDVLAAFYYGRGSARENGALNADNAADVLPPGITYFSGAQGFGQSEPDDTSLAEAIVNRVGGTAFGMTDFGGYGHGDTFAVEAMRLIMDYSTAGELRVWALESFDTGATAHDQHFRERLVLYGDPTVPLRPHWSE